MTFSKIIPGLLKGKKYTWEDGTKVWCIGIHETETSARIAIYTKNADDTWTWDGYATISVGDLTADWEEVCK